MWSLLTDIAQQKEHFGNKYSAEVWKVIFLRALQKEVQLMPSLDGKEIIPLLRTSDMSKDEMSELIEFIISWALENGVPLSSMASEAVA
jgi:hypothetical protein